VANKTRLHFAVSCMLIITDCSKLNTVSYNTVSLKLDPYHLMIMT